MLADTLFRSWWGKNGGQGLDTCEVMGTDKRVSRHSLLVNSWIINFWRGYQTAKNKVIILTVIVSQSFNMLKGLENFSYE